MYRDRFSLILGLISIRFWECNDTTSIKFFLSEVFEDRIEKTFALAVESAGRILL